MEATLQRDRLVQQLTDARSEIEENQRAVLETLKLSSEIQARESEYKHQMENEREGHGRTRNDLESCKFVICVCFFCLAVVVVCCPKTWILIFFFFLLSSFFLSSRHGKTSKNRGRT